MIDFMHPHFISFSIAALLLTGCGPSRHFETPPVEVLTPEGPVLCQLYSKTFVDWDRAIQKPETMSHDKAKAICVNAGLRWKNS
jgi:hypothetical protein